MAPENFTLDFGILDDVLGSAKDAENSASPVCCRANSIGPLVEYEFTRRTNRTPSVRLLSVDDSSLTYALRNTLATTWDQHPARNSSLQSNEVEFSRIPSDQSKPTDPFWTAYVQRAKHAATLAGFSPNIALQLVGSFLELVDNVWRHSEASGTGLVGYRRANGELEYVISDAGIGVLASMRKKTEYARLNDTGNALEIAIGLAETEFGRRTGGGEGYRRMFANLVNMNGTLRIRSGDHGISWHGEPTGRPKRCTFQTFLHQGFIVSLTCRV
jgi:hypothetical protein